jgi:hypothetical protein
VRDHVELRQQGGEAALFRIEEAPFVLRRFRRLRALFQLSEALVAVLTIVRGPASSSIGRSLPPW